MHKHVNCIGTDYTVSSGLFIDRTGCFNQARWKKSLVKSSSCFRNDDSHSELCDNIFIGCLKSWQIVIWDYKDCMNLCDLFLIDIRFSTGIGWDPSFNQLFSIVNQSSNSFNNIPFAVCGSALGRPQDTMCFLQELWLSDEFHYSMWRA